MAKHKNADWIIAWAEGKEVQARQPCDKIWKEIGENAYYSVDIFEYGNYEFRLKPRRPREWIAVLRPSLRADGYLFETTRPLSFKDPHEKVIHVREVLTDES